MKNIYAGSLFAVMCFGAGGVASAQGSCEQDIQQLRQQLGQQQIDQQLRRSIEQMLTSAANNPSNCDSIVTAARNQLQAVEPQQDRQQGGNPTTNVQVEQPAANIDVQTRSPQVNVEQQPTQVTVEQQPPQVEITQPEPEVTVRQAEPNVEVEQARPEVQVSQAEPEVEIRQAEPEVTVRQAGEPEVDVERSAETNAQAVRRAETSARAEREAQLARQSAAGDAELDIVGNNVINRDGDDIGEISGLARSRTSDQMYALVDVGGFFGIGERTVAIPIEQARTDEDGNLVTQYTREQLEQMPEYDPQQYLVD